MSETLQGLTDDEWEEIVKRILKAEIKRAGFDYAQVAEALTRLGVPIEENVLRNKIARGNYRARFLLQVLAACGVSTLSLADIRSPR